MKIIVNNFFRGFYKCVLSNFSLTKKEKESESVKDRQINRRREKKEKDRYKERI